MTNEHQPSINSEVPNDPELHDPELHDPQLHDVDNVQGGDAIEAVTAFSEAIASDSEPRASNATNAEETDEAGSTSESGETDAALETDVLTSASGSAEVGQLELEGGPDDEELFRAIEAILMVADEPVTPQLLGELLEVGPARAEALCNKLNERFTEENRGFVVARVAGGYRFQSHPDLAAYVERFVLDGQAARLSTAAMETLAIVAYKQPISRAQVAAIRGVNVDGVMRTLVQRNYVAEIAIDPGPGQATLFGTTSLFLQNLGLDSIAQLPPLGDLVPGAEVMEALEASLRVDSETGRMTRGTGAGLDGNPTEVPIGLAQEPGETLVDDGASQIADEASETEELFDLETLDSAIIDAPDADLPDALDVPDASGAPGDETE
jgi:segregation and condensation protein B